MIDFNNFGIKRRISTEHNYNAAWRDLKTVRFGEGIAKELEPDKSEFYDISLGPFCSTGKCSFCYVAASPNGHHYKGINQTWKKWMSKYEDKVGYDLKDDILAEAIAGVLFKTMDPNKMQIHFAKSYIRRKEIMQRLKVTYTQKPFQIAIGSEGEPTEHPEFSSFLKTVYETGVVPNFTTNGVILGMAGHCDKNEIYKDYSESERHEMLAKAWEILDYTKKYVGGVAVSYSNPNLRNKAKSAIEALAEFGNTNINIHHIISDKNSVDEFIKLQKDYGDEIKYHVLLPLMASGRSKNSMDKEAFDYLEEEIEKNNIKNVAFGANFSPYLNNSKIKTWNYPPESFSKNVLLKENKVVITPSSFNMKPIKIINL